MEVIGSAIGRGACLVLGSLVYQCQSGESVAFVGYAIILIVLVACLVTAVFRRP